jgi:hypothetical protein
VRSLIATVVRYRIQARFILSATAATVTVAAEVFMVLALLVTHPSHAATRGERLERTWHGAFICALALLRRVTKPRKTAHDDHSPFDFRPEDVPGLGFLRPP